MLLIACAFILLFLNLGVRNGIAVSLLSTLVQSVILFSATIVFATEILSVFKGLYYYSILSFWLLFLLSNAALLSKKRSELHMVRQLISVRVAAFLDTTGLFSKIILGATGLILILVFFQGLLYPPNNYDVMTYHMARIPHWLAQHSVAHYPTHIFRQIYQPPFSSFVFLHVNLLGNSDLFTNSIQFVFMMFSVAEVYLIIQAMMPETKLGRMALILMLTLPAVLLQASGSTNNIMDAFFILATVWLSVCIANGQTSLKNYSFLGLSVGLSVLTKGTSYLYLFPVILMLACYMLYKSIRSGRAGIVTNFALTILVFLLLAGPFYNRNYRMNHNFLGLNAIESEKYSNQQMSPGLLFSSLVKNAGLHMGPFPLSRYANKLIHKLHTFTGININTEGVNFDKYPFEIPDSPNFEDCAPNPVHFSLIILSLFIVPVYYFRNHRLNRQIMPYALMIVLQAVLFAWYLKWQPWHSRNQIPLFMLSIPLICYTAQLNSSFFKLLQILTPLMLIYALGIIVFNRTRPFISLTPITESISVKDARFKKYFTDKQTIYPEFFKIEQQLTAAQHKRIGLFIDWNEFEYPLFAQSYTNGRVPVHIMTQGNPSAHIPLKDKRVDCIVSTKVYLPYIDYEGEKYYKLNEGSQLIALYQRK